MTSISINEVSKTAKHVYVINCTKSDLSITVKDEDGVSRLLRFLRASVPQDAAEVISASMLKKNAHFKRAIAQGYLRIITDEEAQEILARPESKVELASVRKKLSRVPAELMVEGSELSPLEAVSGGASSAAIREELKDIAVSDDESADDKFSRLITLNNEEALSNEEISWLLSRLPTSGNEYKSIITWLREKIS